MYKVQTREIKAGELRFVCDEAGAGDNIALMLHGFPESRIAWRFQIPMLADLGWHVIAPDLRGYGDSSRPTGRGDYKVDQLVEDVTNIFDAVGAKRRLLIGHDWGALVAWVYAMEGCLPLDGLIIMNLAHPTSYSRVFRRTLVQKLRSWYAFFFWIPKLPENILTLWDAKVVEALIILSAKIKGDIPSKIIEKYRSNAMIPGAMTAMLGSYRDNKDLVSRFAKPPSLIATPTLMVWGQEDVFIDIECTQNYTDLVSDLTLKLLAGVGHWVQQEAHERVNDIVERWITTRL